MADTLLYNLEQRIADLQFRLQYVIEPIEELRLEVKKRTRLFWIILLVSVFAILGGYYVSGILPLLWGILLAVLVGGISYYFWIGKYKNILISKFNKDVVPHIISEFLVEVIYDADGSIAISDYYNSNIFRTNVDRYEGSNYVSGILGETKMQFSKLHTQYKTQTTTKNGGSKTTWHTIFKGIFLIVDGNKHFNGETYILPDVAERTLGGIGRWFQEKMGSTGRGELVYLEDPVFEKTFVVYATDPIEARYLLTPSMQQYFIKLSQHFGKDSISVSFINGKLHLAISGNFELFTFKMNMPLTETTTINYYTQNLLYILSSIEILDLNTRIWGK